MTIVSTKRVNNVTPRPIQGTGNVKTHVVQSSGNVVPLGTTNPSAGGNVQTPVLYKRYKFDTPSLLWTVTHNQNTDMFVTFLKQINGTPFYALVTLVDKNTFQVHLTDAYSGYVDVIFDKGV